MFFRNITTKKTTDVQKEKVHLGKKQETTVKRTLASNILKYMIRLFVIPIIDTLYPVIDLETKFDQIILEGPPCLVPDSEIELTQERWNFYVLHLSRLSKDPKLDKDMFDILIMQKIDDINFEITMSISKSETEPKYITYALFRSKLLKILGDAIDIKYRHTTNRMFIGIFGDQGAYRRFKYHDVI